MVPSVDLSRTFPRRPRRAALARLLGGSKRAQLTSDRQNFVSGDRIAINARLYGAGFEPVAELFEYRLEWDLTRGPDLRAAPGHGLFSSGVA